MTTAQQARSSRKRAGKASAATATQKHATAKETGEREKEHGARVPIPIVTPQVKVYHLPVPAAGGALPPPDRLVFYGGLGAMAALNVISWPVAAAIGVGTMLAGRARRRERSRSDQPESTAEKTAKT